MKFQGYGDNLIEKPVFKNDSQIFINETQYFKVIERDVWDYQIGGYQVLNKWVKDRDGRRLSLEDIKHFCRIATALKKTIEAQETIDTIYANVERTLITFKPKDSPKALKHFTTQ